jgi:hypothetical protein
MGLGEGHALVCKSSTGAAVTLSTNPADCYLDNYDDWYDSMSTGSDKHYNSRTKEAFGWITVPQINANGNYHLNVYEIPESKARR